VPLTETERRVVQAVVKNYMNSRQSTPSLSLFHEFEDPQAVRNVVNYRILRPYGSPPILLPTVLALHYCGDASFLDTAKSAVEAVVPAIRRMSKNDYEFSGTYNLEHLLSLPTANAVPVPSHMSLGLFLVRDFEGKVLSGWTMDEQQTHVKTFQISQEIVAIKDAGRMWDDHIRKGVETIEASMPNLSEPRPATHSGLLVFISHSSKDADLALALIDLLKAGLALRADQIRCSSVDGYRLPIGVSTPDQLRNEVNAAKIVIGLVTPSSLVSHYVMFELGARWGANSLLAPLLAGVKASELSGPLSLLNALSASNDAQLHQLLGDVAKQLGMPLQPAPSYIRNITAVKTLADTVRPSTPQAATNTSSVNGPNLVLVRVLSESLIFDGEQWRRGWVESGPPSPRMDAVFAEIKNAKSESRDVGAALGVKAELTLLKDSSEEELADLAWVDHDHNTVNFQFAETQFVLLAVKRVSHLAKETHWIIPINHKGFNDPTPGRVKIDMGNRWKEEFDIRLRLDMLHIKTGKIIGSFEGRCVWRSGTQKPLISF
jgi:hypothetical protein